MRHRSRLNMLGVTTSWKPRTRYSERMCSVRRLKMRAPCGMKKHEPGDSHSNDKVWTVEVRGDQVLVAWGKVETQLATTTKLFPDALLAEKWAAETVAEKIKAGYAVDESEATA